jgi:hypothetical protein
MNNSKSHQTPTPFLSVIALLAVLTIPNIGLSQISRSPTRILQESGNTVTFDNGSIEVVVQRSRNLLITDKGTYQLSSGRSVTPKRSSVVPSSSLPVPKIPPTRNSSPRQSRSDQLQGELMQSIQMGAILQEQGNSERQYQLEFQRQQALLEQQTYEMIKAEKLEIARKTTMTMLSEIDYRSPDAPDKLRMLEADVKSILPESDFRNLTDSKFEAVRAQQALVEQYKIETGMTVPLDKDGRYDFATAGQQRNELKQFYESGMKPETIVALNQIEGLRDLPISQKLVYGQEHEVADQMVRWAVQNNLLTYDDLSKMGPGLYVTGGAANDTLKQGRAGHVYDLRAVEGVKLSNGRTLSSVFKEVEDTAELSKQSAASSEMVGKQITSLENEAKLLQRSVYGDPEAGTKGYDKSDPAYNKVAARLGVVLDQIAQLQVAKSSFDAAASGTYSPQQAYAQGSQGALARQDMSPDQVTALVSTGLLDEDQAQALQEGKDIQFGNKIITLKR